MFPLTRATCRRTGTPSATIFFAVCVLAGFAPGARACECTYTPTLAEEFASATTVFAGTVTDVQMLPNDYMVTTFTPTIRWKGAVENPTLVYQFASCATQFEVGESYIVFAWQTTLQGQWVTWTHMCASNTWLDPVVIALLPPPETPVPARTPTWGKIKTLYR